MHDISDFIQRVANELTHNHTEVYPNIPLHNQRIPSVDTLNEIVDTIHSIVFPGYSGDSIFNYHSLIYHTGVYVEKLYNLLLRQISDALLFASTENEIGLAREKASRLTRDFLDKLPHIKYMLSTDIKAIFNSDPAVGNYGEIIFCYPAIKAILHYRIAHELYDLAIPVLPRIISELAHSATGIDIHPGAKIDEYFSIDHGTGVVIGQTAVIGKHVTLYQGVTLGAKHFALDTNGHPIDTPRHPIVEDEVTIYSNSSILGRITIGRGTVIGGNIWLTQSVPPYSRILQTKAVRSTFTDGSGI